MLVVLPALAYLALLGIARNRVGGWRCPAIYAAVFWGAILTVITELLSVPRLLTRGWLAVAWLGVTVAGLIFWFAGKRKKPSSPAEVSEHTATGWLGRCLIAGVVVLAAIVGLTAIVSPPNTWDAMDYHMPRVVQWIGNQGVQFFPTWDYAQLIHTPWSEFAMTHLLLLSGGDRFVNVVEWLSLIGSVVGVSLIAGKLGAGRRGQILAAAIVASIPEGILEASGAMNTYAGAFWLVATVFLLLRWKDEPDWFNTLSVGLAAGLALLTKGTAYILLPSLIAASFVMATAATRRVWLTRAAFVAALVLGLNAPQYLRNFQLTGSPTGLPCPEGGARVSFGADRVTLSGTAGNILRNAALHIGTPIDNLNKPMEGLIKGAIRMIGGDPQDPATTWRNDSFSLGGVSVHEITAGNPLQFALILATSLFVLFKWRKAPAHLVIYTLGVGAASVLFCALVKWQVSGSRFQLPLFVLASVIAAMVLERFVPWRIAAAIAAVLLLTTTPLALMNRLRPLAPWQSASILRRPRAELYFTDQHEFLMKPVVQAAAAVKTSGCRDIAVDDFLNPYVYPLFALLGPGAPGLHLDYAGVENRTSVYARSHRPCAVICMGCAHIPQKWMEYRHVGARVSVFDDIAVFGAAGQAANDEAEAGMNPADNQSWPALLAGMDSDRREIRAFNLDTAWAWVRSAGRAWPEKRLDLESRRDDIREIVRREEDIWEMSAAARQRASRNQMRDADPALLLTVAEALRYYGSALPGKFAELKNLTARL